MRHAFLILAHNEFKILQLLIDCIDDSRHDIFVHFDRKMNVQPELYCAHARLYVLDDRLDVRWGDISMLKAEFLLFEQARNKDTYAYYHLISGLHLPLCPVTHFHDFFDKYQGYSVMQLMEGSAYEFDMKFRFYHFFTRNIHAINTWHDRVRNFVWRAGIKIQRLLKFRRKIKDQYVKSSQWVSLTHEALKLILSRKEQILKQYRYTLCPDEFFIPTELEDSVLKSKIWYEKNYLKYDFNGGPNPKTYQLTDYDELVESKCLFARKFSEEHMEIALIIQKNLVQQD